MRQIIVTEENRAAADAMPPAGCHEASGVTGDAPPAGHHGKAANERGNGARTVDVPGVTVVANGMLGTDSVLLVRSSGWANFLVASIASITGNPRRSTKIRATSRCSGFGISTSRGIRKSVSHRA